MISVLRQLPRNSRIISAVRHAAITASRTTSATAALTKIDWSAIALMWSCGGIVCSTRGNSARMSSTTLIVDALPAFRTRHQHAALAVQPHDVGLRRETRR